MLLRSLQVDFSMDEKEIQVKKSKRLINGGVYHVQHQGRFGVGVKMKFQPKGGVRRIDKDHYEVISSGEVLRYFHKKDGAPKSKDSLRRTFKELEGLIRTNFSDGGNNQVFMTLTYAENMKDTKRLYKDFEKFWKRLTYHMKKSKLEYLSVAEPQGRGAWHLHVLVKDTVNKNLYIDGKWLHDIWGHGYVSCERLKGHDVGKYYVTYFTTALHEQVDLDPRNKSHKKMVKTSRLDMYPTGFRFYRRSKGIMSPKKEWMEREDFMEEYPALISFKGYDIIRDGDDKPLQVIEIELREKRN